MVKYIFLIMILLFIPFALAELQIVGNSKNGIIKLGPPTTPSSSCTCTAGNSTGINETYGDTIYMRLDQTNNGLISNNIDIQGYNLSSVDFLSVLNRIDTLQYNAQDGFMDYLTVNEWINMTNGNIYDNNYLSTNNLSIESQPSCDADNEKLETNASGFVYCGVNEISGNLTNWSQYNAISNVNMNYFNISNASCISQTEYIEFDDAAAAPSGYLPGQGGATLSMARGFPVRYNMEIRSIHASSVGKIICIGTDSTTNNSCKYQPEFNISGSAFIYGNITLYNVTDLETPMSINLSKGDGILIRMFGSTAGNSSSSVWSSAMFMIEARKRC